MARRVSRRKSRRSKFTRKDRHELYEAAVQDPEVEVKFVSKTFRRLRGRPAMTVREDFCGTAIFCVAWAKSDAKRHAIGLDLHQPTLNWGLRHRIRPAGEDVVSRIDLRNADVRVASTPKVDVAVGFNFSYWCFKSRPALLKYFVAARKGLKSDGVLFLDLFGGTEAPQTDEDERECETPAGDDFTYVWEQAHYDALTADFLAHIHFRFDDQPEMTRAFTYDWRMWTLVEIRELLLEAGFSETRVFFEREDEDDEPTGHYYQPKIIDNEGVWWGYVAALV